MRSWSSRSQCPLLPAPGLMVPLGLGLLPLHLPAPAASSRGPPRHGLVALPAYPATPAPCTGPWTARVTPPHGLDSTHWTNEDTGVTQSDTPSWDGSCGGSPATDLRLTLRT